MLTTKNEILETTVQNFLKGTVSIILSDPSLKDGNASFTTVPLKALSEQVTCAFLA